MRIHEFAKQHGLSNKELIDRLNAAGFQITGHMSILSDDALKFLGQHAEPAAGESISAQGGEHFSEDEDEAAEVEAAKLVNVRAVSDSGRRATKPSAKTEILAQQQQQQQRLGRRFGLKTVVSYASSVSEISIPGDMPLHEVAKLLGKDLSEVVLMLLQRNLAFTRNQLVPKEIIANLAQQLGIQVIATAKPVVSAQATQRQSTENLQPRWPIVVVMGHVDHGKTTLLDFIRKSSVAAREKGGITQHLGAYEVRSQHGTIVFLDTPGHEAFTALRGRGASVTDLVVLVVAADDGVKPQTIEAIEQAHKSGAPIIVAINKIDKEGAEKNIDAIKRQLAQHEVLVEDWGGQVMCIPISAKSGKGVENLLEMIVLQSQMMDLRANPDAPVRAFVLESKVERGYGPVSTVIPLEGTLRKGDFFVAGDATGKVRLLVDSSQDRVDSAAPSVPVMVAGFDAPATPGSTLEVVSTSEYAKARSTKHMGGGLVPVKSFVPSGEGAEEAKLRFMIKADTHGTIDALHNALSTLGKKNKQVGARMKLLSSNLGDITEGDVLEAADSDAILIGLGIKTERNAASAAKQHGVEIISNPIIYHLVEEIEKRVASTIQRAKVFKQVGKAEVRKVFDMKGRVIAGCYVIDGMVSRGNRVVCMRNGEKVGEGKINSLQRDRNVVKEVAAGYECGFVAEGFNGWQVGDIAICFIQQEIDQPDATGDSREGREGRRENRDGRDRGSSRR